MEQPTLQVESGGERLTKEPTQRKRNTKNALGGNRLTEGIEHDSPNHGDPPMGRALRTRRADGMLQEWRDEGGGPWWLRLININNPLGGLEVPPPLPPSMGMLKGGPRIVPV